MTLIAVGLCLIAIHVTAIVLCYRFARQNGRSPVAWLIAGMFCGLLALVVLVFLPDGKAPRPVQL